MRRADEQYFVAAETSGSVSSANGCPARLHSEQNDNGSQLDRRLASVDASHSHMMLA
jgi:hypothetical protein